MFPPLQWDGLRSLLIMSAALATARNFETRHSIQYKQQENIMSRLITFLHVFKLIVSGDIAAYQITAASLLSACCHRFQQSWRQSFRFEASMTFTIFLKDQRLEIQFHRCNTSRARDTEFLSVQHKHAVPYQKQCPRMPQAMFAHVFPAMMKDTFNSSDKAAMSTSVAQCRLPHVSSCTATSCCNFANVATPERTVCCVSPCSLLPESEPAKHRRGPGHPQQH